METGLKKVKKFLSEGDLVKISIVFKGRQMAHTEFGPKLLEKILSELGENVQKERDSKFHGRRYVTIIKPVKTSQNKRGTTKDETKNKKGSSEKVQNNSKRENPQGSPDELTPKSSKK